MFIKKKRGWRVEPVHIMIMLFGGVILTGAVLLKLPFAHKAELSFVDALFISTSATCITGLATINIGTTFTIFGQVVIMFLMQLGALGIMSVSSIFMLMLGKPISMRDSTIVHGSLTMSRQINIRKLIRSVFVLMLIFELVGWAFFTFFWTDDFGFNKALYYGLFHSISAFCNAGISIFPEGLTGFEKDPAVATVFTVLITGGAIGFVAISEIYERSRYKGRVRRKWSLQTRLVVIYTLAMTVIGTVGFLIFELDNVHAGMPFSEQLMSAVFHSVSGRTAGFATIDPGLYHNTTLYLFILFMFIGGAPASTAGGIKLTTLAILIGMAVSRNKGYEKVNILNRAIPEQVVSHAISIVSISAVVVITFTILLLITESGSVPSVAESRGQFLEIAFEVVSAFGTTGLSMGLTPMLSTSGKLLIALLMLIGRVGPISIAMAVGTTRKHRSYQLSEESIMVG